MAVRLPILEYMQTHSSVTKHFLQSPQLQMSPTSGNLMEWYKRVLEQDFQMLLCVCRETKKQSTGPWFLLPKKSGREGWESSGDYLLVFSFSWKQHPSISKETGEPECGVNRTNQACQPSWPNNSATTWVYQHSGRLWLGIFQSKCRGSEKVNKCVIDAWDISCPTDVWK